MKRRTISPEIKTESFYATDQPETKAFMEDIMAVMEKHKLCIVPTYGSRISYHDTMRVIIMDEEAKDFFSETGVCF